MLFAVASALVNCTNSYDYEEPDPKMVELAKYAKQHVPEQHPKVREPERLWGPLCLWDQLTWGIHSSLNVRVSKFLSLCTPVHRFVLYGGFPFSCPVSQGSSANKLPPHPGQSRFRAGSGEEAAGGGRGVGHDVHGEDGEPRADQFLPRAALQVRPPRRSQKPRDGPCNCRGAGPRASGSEGPPRSFLPSLSPDGAV